MVGDLLTREYPVNGPLVEIEESFDVGEALIPGARHRVTTKLQ